VRSGAITPTGDGMPKPIRRGLPRPVLATVVAALLAVGPLRAEAQSAADSAATKVAAQYISALQNGRLHETAALAHREALTSIRKLVEVLAKIDEGGTFRSQVLKVGPEVDIAKLTDQQYYAAFVGLAYGQPGVQEALRSATSTILGVVPEGETLHVLHRMKMTVEEIEISKMEVLSLRMDNGQWRVMLSGDIESMRRRLETMVPDTR